MPSPSLSASAVLVLAVAGPALADFTPFSGSYAPTRALFEAAAGGTVPMETFESFATGAAVGDMPGVQAFFAPEYADGSLAPLPVVANNSPVTPTKWIVNLGNGRPAWSPWVIRPDAGESIYAFGQANSQGDFVRIEAFAASGALVGTVDSPALSHAFAGFVSSTPIAKVVVTPLGNFDGTNGMDNVQISVVPVPAPAAAAALALGGLLARPRRR